MKGKKLAVLCAAAGIMAMAAAGCGSDMLTREEIVVPRAEMKVQNEGDSQETGSSGGQETEGTIAELVQVPERYVWEGGSGAVMVKADAPLTVPKGDGFKTYKVTSRVFTQEDYDRVSQVLLKGAHLWDRDYEQMEGSHGFTLEEVEERITILEKQKQEAESEGVIKSKIVKAGEKTYDELIEEWKRLAREAPEEAVIIEIPEEVVYDSTGENAENNWLGGTATVEGEDFSVFLDNNLSDAWRWINFQIKTDRINSNFYTLYEEREEEVQSAKIDTEDVREKAREAVASMGFTDFSIGGEEYVQAVSVKENEGDAYMDTVGYTIHFTRVLDGIPVTYTSTDGTTMESDDISSWPYERLDLTYDAEGFASFSWVNPYQVEKVSDENVFLLPFSEIQDIFEEMILKKYGDIYADSEKMRIDFFINEVRLGYMRVFEKGNPMEGEMVPVWDFFGTESFYPEGKEPMTDNLSYESWLTINAMDGTIIDRDLGY